MTTTTSTATPKQGRPDNLMLRPMTEADQKEVGALFVKTFRREPLGAHQGVGDGEGVGVAAAAVVDPVSFVIEDTTLPDPHHRIIAFRTSCLLTAESLAEKARKVTAEGGHDNSVQAILHRMTELWLAKSTVFKTNSDAKVMKFIALGVDEAYEGKGLAKDLLTVSMDKAKEVGCDAVTVVASAFATQHLFANRLGFELMGRVRYSEFEWVDPKIGKEERPFRDLVQPEFLEVFEKKIV
ncbi:hypothetical protein BGX29_012194 [Mortierella sp. GBA35]|nr:hypothetical protein BGX29_012194 [Mortierella sp. GBA35]